MVTENKKMRYSRSSMLLTFINHPDIIHFEFKVSTIQIQSNTYLKQIDLKTENITINEKQ